MNIHISAQPRGSLLSWVFRTPGDSEMSRRTWQAPRGFGDPLLSHQEWNYPDRPLTGLRRPPVLLPPAGPAASPLPAATPLSCFPHWGDTGDHTAGEHTTNDWRPANGARHFSQIGLFFKISNFTESSGTFFFFCLFVLIVSSKNDFWLLVATLHLSTQPVNTHPYSL